MLIIDTIFLLPEKSIIYIFGRTFALNKRKLKITRVTVMKRVTRASHVSVAVLILFAVLFVNQSASASPLYSGTATGTFSDPVKSGISLVDGTAFFYDNTSTAVATGTGTNSISWGTFGSLDGRLPNSLSFVGNTFENVAPDTNFLLGTLTWFNGLANTANTIFGVTLDLSVGSIATDTDSQLTILGTFFTAGVTPTPEQNADCITFSQFSGTICAFEQRGVVINLFGQIVGDPELRLVSFSLVPGQEANGFIVPEPASMLLFLSGLIGLGLWRRKRN